MRAAQADSGAHRGLNVRVAGYSDSFCELSPALEEEILARTEHRGREWRAGSDDLPSEEEAAWGRRRRGGRFVGATVTTDGQERPGGDWLSRGR